MSEGTQLLLDDLIRLHVKARGLELGARRKALSAQAGGYRSAYRGRGMEFDEVRSYQPTDDARTIDWRVTARRGKPHTKLFREERERPVLLLVDLHPGMFFGSQVQFKSVQAGKLAALLGWSATRAGDRVGGVVTSMKGHKEIHPAARQKGLMPLIHSMVELQPQQPDAMTPGGMDMALARLARMAHPGSLVAIFSDFREMGDSAEKHLGSLVRHNDVIACLVNDPLESEVPPAGYYRLGSGNRRIDLDTSQRGVKRKWMGQFTDHSEAVRSLCRRHSIHFMQASTIDDPLRALQLGLKR